MADRKRIRGGEEEERRHVQGKTDNALSSKRKRTRDAEGGASSGDERQAYDVDEEGHMLLRRGQVMDGRYKVQQCSGTGTFGKVYLCEDMTGGGLVAIKVVRRIRRYVESALIERSILEDVGRAMPSSRDDKGTPVSIVRFSRSFDWHGHYCMVFEALGPSLYDYVKANEYRPLPLYAVQSFADQLLLALAFMHQLRLVHTDLKLENILLTSLGEDGLGGRVFRRSDKDTSARDGRRALAPASTSIKVIDFGGATYDFMHKSFLINTRQYRAPEVILGLGWGPPSDVWSLGCILMELYKGELLFATHDNAEHLALMEAVLGPFPPIMLRPGGRLVEQYFDSARTGRQRFPDTARAGERGRESIRHVKASLPLEYLVNPRDTVFLDLVKRMLALDPHDRITAREAVNHRFFTAIRGRKEAPAPRDLPAALRNGAHPPSYWPRDTGEEDEDSGAESGGGEEEGRWEAVEAQVRRDNAPPPAARRESGREGGRAVERPAERPGERARRDSDRDRERERARETPRPRRDSIRDGAGEESGGHSHKRRDSSGGEREGGHAHKRRDSTGGEREGGRSTRPWSGGSCPRPDPAALPAGVDASELELEEDAGEGSEGEEAAGGSGGQPSSREGRQESGRKTAPPGSPILRAGSGGGRALAVVLAEDDKGRGGGRISIGAAVSSLAASAASVIGGLAGVGLSVLGGATSPRGTLSSLASLGTPRRGPDEKGEEAGRPHRPTGLAGLGGAGAGAMTSLPGGEGNTGAMSPVGVHRAAAAVPLSTAPEGSATANPRIAGTPATGLAGLSLARSS